VVDLHGTTAQKANVDVAMELDVEKFWNLMVDAIEVLGCKG
jgi:inosine-uridine nucleoside N-ribohydrolase